MDDILQYIPPMLSGKELDEKLAVLPAYDKSIIEKSATERLIAMQNIYRIFIPNAMSREIYSKLYLALLRSLQKKALYLSHTTIQRKQQNDSETSL